MPTSKHKEKRLHFAGYDFTSGPEGTVVHRSAPKSSEFRSGDRVQYRDVNLWQQGTVTGADGKWVMVRWDGNSFESREWAPNLRHVSTSATAHATKKKSSAQLDREIAEALGRSHATKKNLSAVVDALGWEPSPRDIARAEETFGHYSTRELRREIQSLEDEFEMAGGRGVGLADRLDAARTALALRSSTKKSHATKARARPVTASKETSVLPPSVRVARAGLESMREHGIKNLRYGLYRHSGDRMYQWGNFTGTPEHVITAIVPNVTNTASQAALIRALKWKR